MARAATPGSPWRRWCSRCPSWPHSWAARPARLGLQRAGLAWPPPGRACRCRGLLACLIVEALCIRGLVVYALLRALAFGLYLLPQEALDTAQSQLIPPGFTTTNHMHAWCVVLHSFERQTPSVTGAFDERLQLRAAMRPLRDVQRRGRWATAAALRRHARGGHVLEQLHRLPGALQLQAEQAFTRIGATLSASLQRG